MKINRVGALLRPRVPITMRTNLIPDTTLTQALCLRTVTNELIQHIVLTSQFLPTRYPEIMVGAGIDSPVARGDSLYDNALAKRLSK